MKTTQFFFSLFAAAIITALFSSNVNAQSFRTTGFEKCDFKVLVHVIENNTDGVLLKAVADGTCGFTEIDPAVYQITWYAANTGIIGGGQTHILAPHDNGIRVVVTNSDTGNAYTGWIETPAPPASQVGNGWQIAEGISQPANRQE